jgi:Uma2 family endonuclease
VWLLEHEGSFDFRTFVEVRIRIRPGRFRVPDIALIPLSAAQEKIIETAPVLCIEILSPRDRMGRMIDRVEDYFSMGVPTYWILDPIARAAWVATPGQLIEAQDGILRAGDIEMPLVDVLEFQIT